MKKILAFLLIFVVLFSLVGCKETGGDVISRYFNEYGQQNGVLEYDANSTYYPFMEDDVTTSAAGTTTSQVTTSGSNDTTASTNTPANTPSNTVSEDEELGAFISIADPPSENLILNTTYIDIVDDWTFKELQKKYGDVTDVFYDGTWSAVYKFEKTDVWFGFRDLDWGKPLENPDVWPSVPTDKNGKWIFSEAPLPQKNAKCNAVYNMKAKDLFDNMNKEIDVVDLETYGGLTLDGNFEDGGKYYCTYRYKHVYIEFESDENYAVWPNGRLLKIKRYSDID